MDALLYTTTTRVVQRLNTHLSFEFGCLHQAKVIRLQVLLVEHVGSGHDGIALQCLHKITQLVHALLHCEGIYEGDVGEDALEYVVLLSVGFALLLHYQFVVMLGHRQVERISGAVDTLPA